MKYPKTMHEATEAAHDERSKAFFDLLRWMGTPIRLLTNYIVSKVHSVKGPKPVPKSPCTP